jgi:hypothetical protein
VVFNSTTGMLKLDQAENFQGTIVGLSTVDGTQAHSDQIDLADISLSAVSLANTTYTNNGNGTGTLTLENSSGQTLASLNFDGNYQLANFTITSDSNGDTLIFDPPVNANGQTNAPSVPSNHNSTGTAGTDGFVFNFGAPNPPPATNFHPEQDTFQPGGPASTGTPPPSNGAPDSGHHLHMPLGNVPTAGDDQLIAGPFAKPHLHTSDFHV